MPLAFAAVESDLNPSARRTWPQRLVIVGCFALIVAIVSSAMLLRGFYERVNEIGRVQFSGDLLASEPDTTQPLNFLVIGLDSALGLDPDDPATFQRQYDPRGTHNADSIALVRVDPTGGQVWALSLPRDLLVEIPGSRAGRQKLKINAASLIGGAPLLVETITSNFQISINHFVQLDFLAFREVVDELGGVSIWLPYPARDEATGFVAPEAGCIELDGETALSFVRSRHYEEYRDGVWVTDPTADFGRIDRQQAFIYAALERAVARGARSPLSLSALITAAVESLVFDQHLTPALLIDLAERMSDFEVGSMEAMTPKVADVRDENGNWIGLELVEDLDSRMFNVFRGQADLIPAAEVRFTVVRSSEAVGVGDAEVLSDLGFDVAGVAVLRKPVVGSVIVYPTGQEAQAKSLGRFVFPAPARVEDPSAATMTLVLGESHEAVTFFALPEDENNPAPVDVAIPDLTTRASTGTSSASSTSIAPTSTVATTTTQPAGDSTAETSDNVVGGRSCS